MSVVYEIEGWLFSRLANGTGIRILAIVDAFSRECLALEVDTKLSSQRVTRTLEQAIVILT